MDFRDRTMKTIIIFIKIIFKRCLFMFDNEEVLENNIDKVQEERLRNLSIIKSIRRHLQHPKIREQNLYYVPYVERGFILYAMKLLKDKFYDHEVDIKNLNLNIRKSVNDSKEVVIQDCDEDCDFDSVQFISSERESL